MQYYFIFFRTAIQVKFHNSDFFFSSQQNILFILKHAFIQKVTSQINIYFYIKTFIKH